MPSTPRPDQNFDDIARKFDENIYGSSKGRLRHELLLHYLKAQLDLNSAALKILDAGGGTGKLAADLLPFASKFVLNDVSEAALSRAEQVLKSPSNLVYQQGELQSIDAQEPFDLVLCHAVFEWLEDPWSALEKLVELTKPGGHLSLSFFNLDAHRFGNLLYGNFDYVSAGMPRKNTVRLNPNNALCPQQVLGKLAEYPVKVLHQAGIRCFHDYLKQPEMQITHYEQLLAMEKRFGCQAPYLWLGKYFHVIVQKLED